MSTTLRLNCLIEGEDIVFVVAAVCDDEVSDLKERIQEKRAQDSLKDVGPHILQLWKPKDSNPIAVEPIGTLIERIGLLEDDLSEFAVKLEAVDSVFSIFPTQPPRDCINIIVKSPHTATQLLSLNCLVLGDAQKQVFTVKIPKTDSVGALQSLIKEKREPHLNHVGSSDLKIWKVSFAIGNLGSEDPPTIGPSLKSHIPLSTVFSLALRADHIHIAVHVPEADTSLTGGRQMQFLKENTPQAPSQLTSTQSEDEHPSKRRHLEVEPPRTPPRQVKAQMVEQTTLPHLNQANTEIAMDTAIQPFGKYINYLAKGKLDCYLDTIGPEGKKTDLDMDLPLEPTLLLHGLGGDLSLEDEKRICSLFLPASYLLCLAPAKPASSLRVFADIGAYIFRALQRQIGCLAQMISKRQHVH